MRTSSSGPAVFGAMATTSRGVIREFQQRELSLLGPLPRGEPGLQDAARSSPARFQRLTFGHDPSDPLEWSAGRINRQIAASPGARWPNAAAPGRRGWALLAASP